MLKRKLSTLILAATITNLVATPANVFAETLTKNNIIEANQLAEEVVEEEGNKAKVSKFELYDSELLESYNEVFKMDNSNIESITNNGGIWNNNSILNNAIDGDFQSHWETGNPNNPNFTNYVTITFKEPEILDRIVYGARRDASGKGFAQELEIYASNTENNNDFKLVATGEYSGSSLDIVEIKFDATEFKRIKFVFKKAYGDWASANEFAFYRKDEINEKVNNLFVDGTMSSLNEEFKNIEAINELENETKDHPLYENYKEDIELAKEILENGQDIASTVWSLERRGNSIKESSKRKMWNFQDWQPTGYSVKAGDVINVYVDVEDGEPTPTLVFKQMDRQDNGNTNISLVKGKNTIVIPNTIGTPGRTSRPGVAAAGVLYTSNPYTENEQSREPKIRIEGAGSYPHYISGIDNDEEVMAELEEYVALLENDPTLPDVFDVFGDRTLVNVRATYALEWYKSNNRTPSYTAHTADSAIRAMMDFYGFDDSEELNSDFNFRYITMLKYLNGGAFMNAANGITGINEGSQGAVLDYSMGWGLAHEMGHNFEFNSLTIHEVTNNMPSLYFQYLMDQPSKITAQNLWESKIFPKVVLDDHTNKEWYPESDVSQLTHLAPLWQLQLYKKDFWPEYIKKAKVYKTDAPGRDGIHRGWIKLACDVLELNLVEHFERHGVKVDEDIKEYASKYQKPDKKLWYINDKYYVNKGGAFTENLEYSISSIKQNGQNLELRFEMNEEDVNNTLGYEIYRDGQLIGFTAKNSYVDTTATIGQNHEYKIVAYDMDINPKGEASYKVFTPSISLKQNEITIPLNSEFNAKDYVKALNYLGEDISTKLQVEGTVNTKEKGLYTIKFTVEDEESVVEKSIDVKVVSKVDYLSDMKYTINKSGWGGIKNNLAPAGGKISVLVEGEDTEFAKGIGAHAQSEIVFDIANKEYEYFYALIGLDKNVRNSNSASAKYKVLVDDKLVYESGTFGCKTNAEEIKINVKGASKLTLITDINNGVDTADNTVWADAKFITNSSAPEIQATNKSTKLGKEIDLKKDVTAYDVEDGDLTSKVEVIGDVNFNKTGEYVVTYKVTDLEGNESTLERNIAVVDMNDSKYLTDYAWKATTHSYTVPKKDIAISGNKLRLTGENGQEVVYDRGIGAHSNSTITYDLTDKDYAYFTSYVGVDRQMYGSVGSVVFEVWVDGEKKFDSGLMTSKLTQKYVEVDINGAKELKLVVADGGNGIGSDHGAWGDAKLHFANNEGVEVNRTELDSLIETVNSLDKDCYIEESYNNLQVALEEVNVELGNGYNQEEIDNLFTKLNEAYENLEIAFDLSEIVNIPDKALKNAIKKELSLTSDDITIGDMFKLTKLNANWSGIKNLEGLQYAKNLENLNLDYNQITNISTLKGLKNLSTLQVKYQNLTPGSVSKSDNTANISFDVIDKNGDKLNPTQVTVGNNKSSQIITLDLEECIDENGLISFDTANLDKAIYNVYLVYEDKEDNYLVQVMYILDNR